MAGSKQREQRYRDRIEQLKAEASRFEMSYRYAVKAHQQSMAEFKKRAPIQFNQWQNELKQQAAIRNQKTVDALKGIDSKSEPQKESSKDWWKLRSI